MPITLDELTENLFRMNGVKSPGNDGLTVEFYKQFWEYIKMCIFNQSLTRFQLASYRPLRNKPLSSF